LLPSCTTNTCSKQQILLLDSAQQVLTCCHVAAVLPCPAGGNRYLSSDISYFGVGSKNAAFYLGKTVKVVSKTSDSSYVHELCIQGKAEHTVSTKGICKV
jgi:hypothetical protein